MDTKLLVTSFRNVAAAAVYIFGVSQFMYYGENFFGKVDNNLMPFMFLTLFSLSAAVVGSLVFGQAIFLFLDNKKTESMKAIAYSIGWLFLIFVAAVTISVIIK